MDKNLLAYLENTRKPWGVLFYRMVWHQIGDVDNLNIIDFGSGFGITANHYAKKNKVIAIEPNEDMVDLRIQTNQYTQIVGGLEKLYDIEENSIDYIICHNVLEYVKNKLEIVQEFERVLKPEGNLSIVKHNHLGRIMQKVVFENNIDEAIGILDGEDTKAMGFGKIGYYEHEALMNWSKELTIEQFYGVRTFWALQQDNEVKKEQVWQDKMFDIEKRVSKISEFKDISFYHHLKLKKESDV